MSKADELLKSMIRFHGKRIAKGVVGDLPVQVRQMRKDVRSLQKAVAGLTKKVDGLLDVARAEAPVPAAPEEVVEGARFTKRTLPALRKRFDLTQHELAKLLQVTAISAGSWERGTRRPTEQNLAKIIALRSMTQEQVDAALGREPAMPALSPEQIRDLRKKLELSQGQFAKLLGVSTVTVGGWEQGRSTPRANSRGALAQVKAMAPKAVVERLGAIASSAGAGQAVVGRLSPAEILEIRKSAGLSQRGMARAIGASVNSVCNWEKGHSKPRAASLEKLLAMRK
jgi:putative transcriptional regulator